MFQFCARRPAHRWNGSVEGGSSFGLCITLSIHNACICQLQLILTYSKFQNLNTKKKNDRNTPARCTNSWQINVWYCFVLQWSDLLFFDVECTHRTPWRHKKEKIKYLHPNIRGVSFLIFYPNIYPECCVVTFYTPVWKFIFWSPRWSWFLFLMTEKVRVSNGYGRRVWVW